MLFFSSVIILLFTVSLLKFTSQNQSTGAFRCMFNNIIQYIFDYEKNTYIYKRREILYLLTFKKLFVMRTFFYCMLFCLAIVGGILMNSC